MYKCICILTIVFSFVGCANSDNELVASKDIYNSNLSKVEEVTTQNTIAKQNEGIVFIEEVLNDNKLQNPESKGNPTILPPLGLKYQRQQNKF